MSRFLIILFFFNIILLSCKNDDKEYIRIPDSSMKILDYKYTKDSMIKRNRNVAQLKEWAKLMKLSSMDNLQEGNCIRIWNWSLDSSNYVVEIHYGVKKNIFSLIHFGPFYTKDSVQYIVIHSNFRNLEPKLSWDSLLGSIKKYQIAGLPDGKMNQSSGLTHSDNIQIETVESDKYNFCEFYSPDYYRTVDSNANKVYSFLNHLNQQAGIRFYKGDHNFVYDKSN